MSLLHAPSCFWSSALRDSRAFIATVSSTPDWIFLVSSAFRAVSPSILERSSSTCCCASEARCRSSAAQWRVIKEGYVGLTAAKATHQQVRCLMLPDTSVMESYLSMIKAVPLH